MDAHERNWLLHEKHGGAESASFSADLTRLENGEPLAYIIGYTPFHEARIYLDSHPMIPRVETEYWLTIAFKAMVDHAPHGARILDLCAGSGCIGIATLLTLSDATVDFAEQDIRHHDTIKKNLTENGIEHTRARILGGDLFECIDGTYDYILTNPPYLDPDRAGRIERSVLAYEPKEALMGGTDGMAFITRILDEGYKHLNKNGQMYLEHEPEQTEAIKTNARERGYRSVTTLRDQYDVERVTRLERPFSKQMHHASLDLEHI